MAQVGSKAAELQPVHPGFPTMDSEHPIEQASADERRAEAQWAALLARLQAPAPGAERLRRVRNEIASGEFHVDARAIAERMLARWLTS